MGSDIESQLDTATCLWPHSFCSTCVVEYRLPDEEVLPESVLEDYAEAFETVLPVCGLCFKQWCEAQQAINASG
jgi:hypothetical protein